MKASPFHDVIFPHEEPFKDIVTACGAFLIVVSSHVSVVGAKWPQLHVK